MQHWARAFGRRQHRSTLRTTSTIGPSHPHEAAAPAPRVVVMRGKFAEEHGLRWPDAIRATSRCLLVCEDAARVGEKLREEYAHTHRGIGFLTQNLRDGEPVKMRPTLLLSQASGAWASSVSSGAARND